MTVFLPLLLVPWIFPFDNDMKSYNTTLSSYYTNDNASSTVSCFLLKLYL